MTDLVPAAYHPTVAVHDLPAARDWFRRVFGRRPLSWAETLDVGELNEGYPIDYSFFAFVCDLHWVFLCPELHARGALAGQRRYRDVPEGMIGLGWYTTDAVRVVELLADAGVRSHDQQGRLVVPGEAPRSSFLDDVLTAFTDPDDTGVRFEFQETARRHWPHYAEAADPRLRADWDGREGIADDPLRLVATSHHTVVTARPDRVTALYVDVLGARVLPRTSGADGALLLLGDTVLEIVADPGSERDRYTAVTFVVEDLDAVAAHLDAVAVPHETAPGCVTIAPADGLGVLWRFVGVAPYDLAVRPVTRLAE
jgi:catechol 2,3-dioxygenase-like lactoylglutathione lyase family enzyme